MSPSRGHGPTSQTPIPWFLLALALFAPPVGAADEPEPWAVLEAARESLHRGPQVAEFAQTYVPAGFSSGDTETGRLRFELPRCLEWDYEAPERKGFLLCGDSVWAWTEEDNAGRHYVIDPEEEPGLDLLLLDVEVLRERYRARVEDGGDGRWRILLVPHEAEGSSYEAALTIETGTGRPVELAYVDGEGNSTRFDLSDYRPSDGAGPLAPPGGIEWVEE